ncbi:MAG: ribonuclease Y [Thermodesulfobacteriota bacterium]
MNISVLLIITAVAILAVFIGVGVGFFLRKRLAAGSIEAEKKIAESVVAEAKKEAENIKKEASLQAKDKLYQGKLELDNEAKERRQELQSVEKRLMHKEESLDKKIEAVGKRESDLARRDRNLIQQERRLQDMEKRLTALVDQEKTKLERISSMSAEEAKRSIIELMENEARLEGAKTVKRVEEEIKETADNKAKEIISLAIQRYAGEYVAEKSVSVVHLPNDEMKGRIIGREGRNIRAIEAATGVEVLIDDTPEAVLLSAHNPVRREIAKQSMERLVSDGRIHPARIEEVVAKVEKEVEQTIREAGERAVFDTGIHRIHPEIVKLIGRFKFRSSYSQNVYLHSLEVAFICGIMAAELGMSTKVARRAGLLHDLGKAVDHEIEGPHADIGAELAKKYGESNRIVTAIKSHHDDSPESILGVLVQAADALSAARPGVRKEMYERYVQRLEDLEKVARGFQGVEKTYAIQAGREIRVMVENKSVTDDGAVLLSKDIAKKIEKELTYPGQIRVVVIRETRSVDYAR